MSHRKMLLKIFALVFLLLLAENIRPQVIEDFAESQDEFSEGSELLDRLDDLKRNPVNLNLASIHELLRLPWLTPFMAKEIIRYREERGGIRDLSELEQLLGFDSGLLERMSEFVVVEVTKKIEGNLRVEARNRFQWPPRSQDYSADRSKLYSRTGVSFRRRYSIGLLVEKDAYEESYTDYVSYFVEFTEIMPLKKAIVGYYDLEFGEGLVFSPMDFSIKSQGAIKKGNRGVLPSKSSDENRSLSGLALRLSVNRFDLFGFFSNRPLDGNLDQDGSVRSFYETGLHRTELELGKKDALTERLIGGRLEITTESVGSGLTFYRSKYSRPFDTGGFSGSEYRVIGIDLEGRLKRARFFGEGAISSVGGSGVLLGTKLSAHRFSAGVLYRNYEYDFWSPHSSAFAEYDDNNERGVYCFTRFSTDRGTRIEAYLDLFKTINPTDPGEFPDLGKEFQVSLSQKFSKVLTGQIRYRRKMKSGKLRESLRFQFTVENGRLKLRARTEFSNSGTDERSRGDMEYLNLRYRLWNTLDLEGRIALFSIESYDARIYTYERDLPGYLRNVALFNEGRRLYFLLHYKPKSWLELTLKYANQKAEEIREEFGLQLDLLEFL